MLDAVTDFHALSAAFERVKENQGCAGVDGVTIDRFEDDLTKNLSILARELTTGSYLPLPLLKILVDKGHGEARGLCVPCVRDRVVQTAALQTIEPILEKEFEECSFGYRKGRSVKQAVYRIKELYEQGFRWVVDADIDAFFDSVDHAILLRKVAVCIHDSAIAGLIEKWVKAEVWDGTSITRMHQGIPQGSPVSPILANLFLDELDETLLKQGYKIVRFADDFIVLCKTPEKANQALDLAIDTLEKLSLKLDEGEVVSFDHGFKYLGVIFARSLIMVPFDKAKTERKVLFYPPPLDMREYHRTRAKGC